MIFFYADSNRDHILFTVREMTLKLTVISLKRMYLESIEDEEATLEDLIEFVKHMLEEQALEVISDPEGAIYEDWPVRLAEYIDNQF